MAEAFAGQQGIVLAVVAGVAGVSFLVSIVLAWRLSKLRREYAVLRGEGGEQDIMATVSRAVRRVDELNRRMDAVWADQQGQQEVNKLMLQKSAIVRYNAFEDMGGLLSFSLAILNDKGDGVVISSINGRTETRTYAKEVRAFESEHTLSQEEREAIAAAGGKQVVGPRRLVASQRR